MRVARGSGGGDDEAEGESDGNRRRWRALRGIERGNPRVGREGIGGEGEEGRRR